MSSTPESPQSDTALQTRLEKNVTYAGLLTRMISWAVDWALINLVAIIAGVGAALIVNIFPITKNLKPLFLAVAGGVYVLWTAAYFVAFWSITGQTPGSRLMQVRLVTPNGEKIRPVRAFVRWIGMNLAMVPLPWGYVPIPFKRLGFPDWLAHTRVIEVQQLSIAATKLERSRDAGAGPRQHLLPSRLSPIRVSCGPEMTATARIAGTEITSDQRTRPDTRRHRCSVSRRSSGASSTGGPLT